MYVIKRIVIMIMVMTIIIVKWIEVVASPCLQTRSVKSFFFSLGAGNLYC